MTNTPNDIHYDPEGIMPPVTDDLDQKRSIIITDLTKEQFDVLAQGVLQAVSKDPRNRTAKFAGKAALLGVTMVFVAACIWTVAQLILPLTNR